MIKIKMESVILNWQLACYTHARTTRLDKFIRGRVKEKKRSINAPISKEKVKSGESVKCNKKNLFADLYR